MITKESDHAVAGSSDEEIAVVVEGHAVDGHRIGGYRQGALNREDRVNLIFPTIFSLTFCLCDFKS